MGVLDLYRECEEALNQIEEEKSKLDKQTSLRGKYGR